MMADNDGYGSSSGQQTETSTSRTTSMNNIDNIDNIDNVDNVDNKNEPAAESKESTISSSSNETKNSDKHNNNKNYKNNKQNGSFGVHGVRLKQFEQVMANILPHVVPSYVCLPKGPCDKDQNDIDIDSDSDIDSGSDLPQWPFNVLPKSARVLGTNPGQLKDPRRAARKEGQLRSMIRCIWRFVPTTTTTTTTTTTALNDNDKKKDKNNENDNNNNNNNNDDDADSVFTIVDFGGGSGHLAIPLALLLPHCRIIVVDLRKRSLDLMQQKATMVAKEIVGLPETTTESSSSPSSSTTNTQKASSKQHQHQQHYHQRQQHHLPVPSYIQQNDAFTCCGTDGVLNNLYTFHGPVEQYRHDKSPFHMAVALHLCGEATDVAIRTAGSVGASAMILAPCCVGKLAKKAFNPDIYNATGQNNPTVQYPQSTLFCQLIPKNNDNKDNTSKSTSDWDALAKAADYSSEQTEEVRTNRNATRRTAKALLETDRRLFLEETYNYQTALMRMDPWEVTPKNDILVAWKQNNNINNNNNNNNNNNHKAKMNHTTTTKPSETPIPLEPDLQCQQDINVSRSQLLLIDDNDDNDNKKKKNKENGDRTTKPISTISSDWTQDETLQIQGEIQQFLHRTDTLTDKMNQVMIFPTGMGKRKRKLIHFCAAKMDLAHWSEGGNKDSEKTVAVARRGRRALRVAGRKDGSKQASIVGESERVRGPIL